jgi:hypothetical protein
MDFVESVVALGSESHFSWLDCLGSYMALGPFHDAIMCIFGGTSRPFQIPFYDIVCPPNSFIFICYDNMQESQGMDLILSEEPPVLGEETPVHILQAEVLTCSIFF